MQGVHTAESAAKGRLFLISCIYPDCIDFKPQSKDLERQKREVIDHINHDHDDAHVICACLHDWQEVERFTKQAAGKDFPQLRSVCTRCDQERVAAVEAADTVDGGEAATAVTATLDGGIDDDGVSRVTGERVKE